MYILLLPDIILNYILIIMVSERLTDKEPNTTSYYPISFPEEEYVVHVVSHQVSDNLISHEQRLSVIEGEGSVLP